MDARTGKKIQLGRLLDAETQRAVVVAASHGVQSGPPDGMRTRDELHDLFPRLRDADAVMLAPGLVGVAEDLYVGRRAPALVIHVDWKNSTRRVYSANTEGRGEGVVASLASVEECAAAGASAIMTYLHVGHRDTALERIEIERNARLARECDRLGLACIIEPRSAQEHVDATYANSAEVITFYCRLAAELGADIVKCVWPGSPEDMAAVTQACPVPILLAGGPGGSDLEATLRLAAEAVNAGAAGVMFGRRITSSPDPAQAIAALRAVVHENADPDSALKEFDSPA